MQRFNEAIVQPAPGTGHVAFGMQAQADTFTAPQPFIDAGFTGFGVATLTLPRSGLLPLPKAPDGSFDLRQLRLTAADSASLAAHYGSVSVVTFAVATAALTRQGIAYESHAPLWVAVMEAPGLVAGILLARWSMRGEASSASAAPAAGHTPTRWGALAHDVLFGKSVLMLMGGLTIGAVAGEVGTAPIKAVFIDPFKGVLALFLLELGLVAGARLSEMRRFGGAVLAVGLLAPPLLAVAGALVGVALNLSTGGVALLATLAASASYIAAPTAMRIAVPQANAALSITAALGITFPFNIVIGIPLYIRLAQALTT